MDVEGEDSRRRKSRRPSPRHHWRSVSWTGGRGGCLDDPTLCCDKNAKEHLERIDAAAEEGAQGAGPCNDAGVAAEAAAAAAAVCGPSRTAQVVLCPPLQSLSVSRRAGGDGDDALSAGGKARRFMRSGMDIKLDLGSMQEQAYDDGGDDEVVQKREKLTQCDKQCSRVLAHVYFGGNTVAQNYDTLHACKITHVLNCVGFVCPEYFPEDFHYKTLWLQDHPREDLLCILYNVFDFFEDVREQSGRVFVHCLQGVSRSASLVIAYLIWRERRTYEDVLDKVKAVRCVVSPNMGFAFQLLQWQSRILQAATIADDHTSLRLYRMAPYSPFDPLHLVPKSVAIPTAASLDSRGAFLLQLPHGVYIWRGKSCTNLLAAAAYRAAFQLIHYEHASGPIVCVREGSEPPEIRNFLQTHHPDGNAEFRCEENPDSQPQHELPDGYELRNAEYDPDFDLLQQAMAGVWVAPMLKGGQLPARDGNWSVHRGSGAGKKKKSEES